MDFAYMEYREILRNYPESKFSEPSLFAVGEYFFINSNFKESAPVFVSFVQRFPDAKGKLFALAYLLKMAQARSDTDGEKDLTNQIVTFKQLGLVFKDSKEVKYASPLYRKLRAVFYIDKIEFYTQGELLLSIAY